jgi:hypothetical protein
MVRSSAASSSPRGTREDCTPTLGYGATREAAIAAFVKKLAKGIGHDKGDTKLNAQDRVILFCAQPASITMRSASFRMPCSHGHSGVHCAQS